MVLREMMHQGGRAPDVITYNAAISAVTRLGSLTGAGAACEIDGEAQVQS